MSESPNAPSRTTSYPSRRQVVRALRTLSARGYVDPFNLPLEDPGVKAVNAMLHAWQDGLQRYVDHSPDPTAFLKYRLSHATIHIEAGFQAPPHITRIVHWWLTPDLSRAECRGLSGMYRRIQAKIDELNALLADLLAQPQRDKIIAMSTALLGAGVTQSILGLDLDDDELLMAVCAELVQDKRANIESLLTQYGIE